MTELIGKTIGQLRQLLIAKAVSAQEILDVHLRQIETCEPDLDAFNTTTEKLARAQAERIDALVAAGDPLPTMAGIPVAVKDNICLPGYPTTCSSRMLEHYVSPYQATAIERLIDSGAVIIGKTNLDEFAMGSSTENSAFKATRNPWSLDCVPGGSSGGSAVAVSSGMSTVALGSDTGGSIRQPAALSGVVGMKPTYGRVSRFGLVAFASSLDQIGPLSRCVEDAAITLSCVAGHDRRDSTSLPEPLPDLLSELKADLSDVRIGVIDELMGEGTEDEVRQAVVQAVKVFENLGAEVDEVSMPKLRYAVSAYYIIAPAEASANLARYDGVRYGYRAKDADDLIGMYERTRREGFGPEVKRRIMLGTYALSSGYYDAYYKKAQQVRRLITEEFSRAFSRFDLLVSPTSPVVAFEIGSRIEDPLQMYLTDIATIPGNLAGLPGISVPCGLTSKRLPVGLQILAPALGDGKVLNAAYMFEKATDFHETRSPYLESLNTA